MSALVGAVFPEMMELETVTVPLASTPPPDVDAEFPEIVSLISVNVPAL